MAALPIARDGNGALRVLLITSRETQRFIIPKGWPMRGMGDEAAAAVEAREEAGVIGRVHPKPVGSYLAWKRLELTFQLVRVRVFLLDVQRRLPDWKEKSQRSSAWLTPEDAAALIDEPGLAQIVAELPGRLPKKWRHHGISDNASSLGRWITS